MITVASKKSKLNFSFPEEKMQALEFCLKEKGKDLDELLNEFLDSLYRKNVPIIMRKFLDPDKKEEENSGENDVINKNVSNGNVSSSSSFNG